MYGFCNAVFAVRDGVGEDLVMVAVESSTISLFNSSMTFIERSLKVSSHCQANSLEISVAMLSTLYIIVDAAIHEGRNV